MEQSVRIFFWWACSHFEDNSDLQLVLNQMKKIEEAMEENENEEHLEDLTTRVFLRFFMQHNNPNLKVTREVLVRELQGVFMKDSRIITGYLLTAKQRYCRKPPTRNSHLNKFKIHNLKLIVQNTVRKIKEISSPCQDVFVFILTYGILLSKWCLEELKSALENKKKVCLHLTKVHIINK